MGTPQIFCSQCGRPSAVTERFCATCGAALTSTHAGTEAGTMVSSPGGQAAYARAAIDPAAPTLFSPGRQIASRYTIIKLLGRGGMGAVYQAWDDELMLSVAIKIILPDTGDDPGTRHEVEQRFKRELLLARQVSHKNVVRIHDIGDVEGVKYITMSFVEGETLASLLVRDKTLPIAQSLTLTRQIAEGLAAAHDVGVIHRDLKPENIMITPDAQAVIMDFGIARSAAKGNTHTQTGTILGTLEYMAPEQARALPLDQRVDVYALGLILYDMLVGRRTRMQGRDTPMSEMMERLQHPPAAPRGLRPEVPPALEALVLRCLQPEPPARFDDAAALLAAIAQLGPDGHALRAPAAVPASAPAPTRSSRMAIAAVLLAAMLGGTGTAVWWRSASSVSAPIVRQPISVLIASFDNLTGDELFDGLVEQALGVGIESASFINVFPRSNALRAAAQLPDKTLNATTARLISIREGIPIVLTGRIEPAEDDYRLYVRALRTDTEDTVLFEWNTEADSKDDVLPAVGRMAARVRAALGDSSADERNVRVEETFTATSLEAAREYVRGQDLLAAGRPEDALAAYTQAVKLDPDLGRAWAGMGTVASNLGRREHAAEYYDQALQRVNRMTEREQFRTRGAYFLSRQNPAQALQQFEELVKRYPSDGAGLSNLALTYFQQRNFERAIALGQQVASLYPKNLLRQNNVALFAMYAGRFDDAEKQARHVLTLNKDYPRAHLAIAVAQMAAARYDEAFASYRTMQQIPTGATLATHGLADAALYRGRLAEAARTVEAHLPREASAAARGRLLSVLASARLAQGATADALRILASIPLASADPATRFEVARLAVLAGRPMPAAASALVDALDPESQALGHAAGGEAALARGDARQALTAFQQSRAAADGWLAHYGLGRAFLALKMFAEADAQFDICLRRRGEVTALFMDDVPTLRMLAPVHFYQGVAREGLGSSSGAQEAFKAFLAIKEGGDETGGLVAEARKRTTS